MDKNNETFTTWNKIAKQYEEVFMGLDIYNHTYNFFCEQLKTIEAKILEIGCGPGNITQYILKQFPNFKIHGVDVAPNMIELAKKNNPKANFQVMDCRNIALLKSKYQGIISGFCLPYLNANECKELFAGINNLLEKNGWTYVSFVEGKPEKSGFQTGSTGDRIFFNFHSLEIITKQIEESGFNIVKKFNIDYPNKKLKKEFHTILIAQKLF